MMEVLLEMLFGCVIQGERGVPRPRPLGKLTAPRVRPLSDDLTGDSH